MPLALLLAISCRSKDYDSGLTEVHDSSPPADVDGDGFDVTEDCDDNDPAVNPQAVEICDDIDNDCNDEVDDGVGDTWFQDADGDGYGNAAGSTVSCEQPEGYVDDDTDCDDSSAEVFPDAGEQCDELDNDCDGEVDEDVLTSWFEDADGDTYGDASSPLEDCNPPEGWVADDTDCDDTDANAFPGNPEVCDEADNDCNGEIDEGVTTTFYEDGDGDGYGSSASAESCELPTGYAEVDGDCDDYDSAVNPDAAESCNGVDDDCDGDTDEDDAVDAQSWYSDSDGDGYGDASTETISCYGDSSQVSDATDCDDSDADIYPGADEHCDSEDSDCDGDVDDADSLDAETWYADSDGDGYGDSSTTTTSCDEPSGYVDDDSDCEDSDSTAYPGSTATETPGDGIDQDCDGNDFCTDLNCDGIMDLAIGSYYSGSSYTTSSALFYGDGSGFSDSWSDTVTTTGTWDVEAGDIDGDGYQDLAFATYYDGSYSASSYIYYGSASGYSSSDRELVDTIGALDVDIEDLDLDGYEDLVFASYYNSGYSTDSYVYYGSATGFSTSNRTDLETYGARKSVAEDLDQDGYIDLVFAEYWDGSSNPDSTIYWGSSSGYSTSDTTDLSTEGPLDVINEDLDGDGLTDLVFSAWYNGSYSTDVHVYWNDRSTGFGNSDRQRLSGTGQAGLASGDWDDDGYTDLFAGSYYDGSSFSTTSYAWWGSSSGYSDSDRTGLSTEGVLYPESADLDADGVDDLIVPVYRTSSSYSTTSYVYYGSTSGLSSADSATAATYGPRDAGAADLDGDGLPELLFVNYYGGSWSSPADSYLYAGSSSGTYDSTTLETLDVTGPLSFTFVGAE
ncbi:MAG TPA: MopE-related protein [Myxococcota bacterium]|nr:MopE-related protein [Myxococcota bacterium]